MDAKVDYRRLVEAKLTALGARARGRRRPPRRAAEPPSELARSAAGALALVVLAARAWRLLVERTSPSRRRWRPSRRRSPARVVWHAAHRTASVPAGVAVRDGNFIVAGSDGTVLALQADTGRELWRAQRRRAS